WLALIKSALPSPLTSAATTEIVSGLTGSEEASAKPPLPLLISTESVAPREFALIRSTLPSPLTSATATEEGPPATLGRGRRAKPAVAVIGKHRERAGREVRANQIHLSMAVDIRRRDRRRPAVQRGRAAAHGVRCTQYKAAAAVIGQHRYRVGTGVGGDQIRI